MKKVKQKKDNKMSRFGLRSASDALKQLDEKPNRRKTCNPVSISMKRNAQLRETKFLSNIKDENLIDDIKVEIEDVEKVQDTTDGPPRNIAINDGDDDDDDEDEDQAVAAAIDPAAGNYTKHSPPTFKGSLICSVPLERINDVLQKLNLNRSSTIEDKLDAKALSDKEVDEIEESFDNDEEEEDDNIISRQSTLAVKNLCLYCDKKFSSHKMQLKHVEKFHCLQQDRRSSGRTSQMQQTKGPRKRKTTQGSQNFPGCTFCSKSKVQYVILPASDLNALFVHLIESHADKYFGCKVCVLRFQNITKLSKHMEIVHKSLPFAFDESSNKSRDIDTDSPVSIDKPTPNEKSKISMKRQHRSQKVLAATSGAVGGNSTGSGTSFNTSASSTTPQCSNSISPNTSIIGAEEPILSRLGLTQNRLPNNRKGIRLRREKLIPEMLLKSEQNHQPSTNYTNTLTTSSSTSLLASATCSPKMRGKAIKAVSVDASSDVIFRVPTRNDILSCVFDDNFYKEVVSNVRNNLLFHLDGKIMGNSLPSADSALIRYANQPQIRSTLVKSPIVVTTLDSEIHAATSLTAVTAFPTLLTAEQFGGEGHLSKLRRPHTKNSWKWKWDNVKKFKLINEGGKIVKKMKHPMLGLRDLSKLDMWTQLTMRQKDEFQTSQPGHYNDDESWVSHSTDITSDPSREEKQRLNDQLNMILDMRILPHIILEQNEQAIIKLENDEFGIAPAQPLTEDCGDDFLAQTFADESFLSKLNLLPNKDSQLRCTKLVLSGEWARPRCYLCMCCGAKFEKIKSLEEHKMFRHSQILSTHYEVVGRELLNGNLLRHLFLPKKALSRYANDMGNNMLYAGAARRLFWQKNETITREIANNEESSDSLQSMLNSCTNTNSPSIKNSSSTEDCDMDTKMATAAALGLMATNTNTSVVSPTHSIQSCSSSSSGLKSHVKIPSHSSQPLLTGGIVSDSGSAGGISIYNSNGCSKCGRKCNGVLDLYRHMLDCSGDYVWSLAKKRKYRYYCGSKKRRPCNKHNILELRKNKSKPPVKTPSVPNESTEEGPSSSANFIKAKTSPRPRPSDAESIKKMLENLPAKRVCKKIFPTLSKTKKTIKNIKPKLLGKHKIYHSLRKTRVRQMSQAAKILSKTKSQRKKSQKNITRSAIATTSSNSSNRRSNRQKSPTTVVVVSNKNTTKTKSTEKTTSNDKPQEEEYTDEVLQSIKQEEEIPLEPSISAQDTNVINENSDNAKNVEASSNVLISSIDSLNKLVEIKQLETDLVEVSNKTLLPTDPKAQDQNVTEKITTSVVSDAQEVDSQSVTLCPNVALATNAAAAVVATTTESERNVSNQKNVKRSKRISDCIAMLTQKLRTDQQVTTTLPMTSVKPATAAAAPAVVANILPQPAVQLAPVMPPTPLPTVAATPIPITPQIQETVLPKSAEVNEAVDSNKSSPPKKTPKRKAISRRIIKNDAIEELSMPIPVPDTALNTPAMVKSISTKPTEMLSLIKDSLIVKPNLSHQLLPSITLAKTNTTATLISNQVEEKQLKTMPATLLLPTMPTAMTVPLNNPHLIPKLPLYVPVENLCAPPPPPTHHVTTMPSLPLGLPVPLPPPPRQIENIVQPSTASMVVPGNSLNLVHHSNAMPLLTTVPPAHLPPPTSLTLSMSGFSLPPAAEPLNLCSASKNAQKQSQDLSFSSRQKFGMPARRQTICGFEARNFVMFDEMEPLDLSKKPRPEKSSPAPPPLMSSLLPKPMEMAQMLMPAQNPLPLTQAVTVTPVEQLNTTLLPMPPLTPEALLNQPFYSNLDLLRIPQVRNPVVGQGNQCNVVNVANTESTPPQPPAPAIVVNNTAIPITKANAAKKRNKPSTIVTTAAIINTNDLNIENSINANIVLKTNNFNKEPINVVALAPLPTTTPTKKETNSKGKVTLRMDEEVINHIDDAINSVINAVKASLDSEEAAEKSQKMALAAQAMLPKTTDDVSPPKESVTEFKYLTAARRNMRSKTLDCRPAALNKLNMQNSIILANNNESSVVEAATVAPAPISRQPTITVKSIDTLMVSDTNKTTTPNNLITLDKQTKDNIVVQTVETENRLKQLTESVAPAKASEPKTLATPVDKDTDKSTNQNIKAITKNKDNASIDNKSSAKVSNAMDIKSLDKKAAECIKEPALAITIPEPDVGIVNIANPAVATSLDLEQMSNNNNTSSGFHSSAQSDQQTSVMSTTNTNTSLSTSVIATAAAPPDIKKKQRRRRKNELAAIVADQLLESFKLDKARRDNLKKLENLAYEKSEDLLLTGMLLMSSTKRNVNSSTSATKSSTTTTTTATAIENNETPTTNKRNSKSQQNNSNAETGSGAEAKAVEQKNSNKTVGENDKTNVENTDVTDGKKPTKRRQYRRRGKTLDNENISKLKSSLESFSIDIERQLSEYEAKNVNVFKNVAATNEVAKSHAASKSQTSTNTKPSVILRPSILSMTLEASANLDNCNLQSTKSSVTNDANKTTVVSSRDPRLNKNIHKEGEKPAEPLVEDKPDTTVQQQKHSVAPEEIGDLEEDNYLTEIAKNVNEKIMSTENEEFAFKDDGFEMANDMGMDDSNSKFSRPPTSMSVRSAPNFNDDRSNFGSICDENTNTEVMDMDLDDEMSVYTSYSQDLGRGRGRRRRRRRSILLTRKPKKRASSRDLSAEKIECILCKKVFYSANSLSKHNMTLAHVSKVSEQEYLLSKSLTNASIINIDQNQITGTLGPYARRSARRATISEAPMHLHRDLSPLPILTKLPIRTSTPTNVQTLLPQTQTPFKAFSAAAQEVQDASKREELLPQTEPIETEKSSNTSAQLQKEVENTDYNAGNNGVGMSTAFNGNSRLNLNPDERLFYECCNILKSAETPRINKVIVPQVAEECNNLNGNYAPYAFRQQDKLSNLNNAVCSRDRTNEVNINMDNNIGKGIQQTATIEPPFRDPQGINAANCYNKSLQDNRGARSPTYSAISHLSAVTNTTSRFKTKAAMKGYETVDLMQHQESKSRTICKLTELAEIALGNEDKPNSHSFSPIQSSITPPQPMMQQPAPCISKVDAMNGTMRLKGLATPDYATHLPVENPKDANVPMPIRAEQRTKNNETRSSTSSKTIMHSSIIKAAVEEHQKTPPTSNKIVIPDRPFKNIGLEEKETITFQKPKTPAVHLLTEDNSVSTGSFSDRDDYDFGSLSCDEEVSVRESIDKNPKNNSSDSSSESSRATAKTFENKSLIMGRIFKNVSTKAPAKTNVAAVKVKSVGVQKDQTPTPKADLNQLFDELRGNSGVDGNRSDRAMANASNIDRVTAIAAGSSRLNQKQHQREVTKHMMPAASPQSIVSSTTAVSSSKARKTKPNENRSKPKLKAPSKKTAKDITKLQSELGMSPDEIKKLIDEGQRKSKRRCATIRPKKLVEMWSSDEYEEFLSTKDIIALIEEKEQEEKRKKRKNSVNSDNGKEKEHVEVTSSSTKEPKRKNIRKTNVSIVETRESLQAEPQHKPETKSGKTKKRASVVKEDKAAVSTTTAAPELFTAIPQKNNAKNAALDKSVTAKTKRAAAAANKKAKLKEEQKPKETKTKKVSSRSKSKKPPPPPTDDDEDDNSIEEDDDDDDDDFLISDLKQKQANRSRATATNKPTTSRVAASNTANVTSTTANVSSSKASQPTRKRTTNNSASSSIISNVATVTEVSNKPLKQTPKNKRKNQTNQSPPRRKRPASEKLYYWSSSSDEDFGRINHKHNNNNNNNNKSNAPPAATPADNFEGGGVGGGGGGGGGVEQYQKHGWIVGDSHKKLVTLLAIAKGNKKLDSSSSVKKNVTKKR